MNHQLNYSFAIVTIKRTLLFPSKNVRKNSNIKVIFTLTLCKVMRILKL